MASSKVWIDRWLNFAKQVATYSKDPSTKVGIVAVSEDNNLLSSGWNGFPRGIKDSEERLNDREIKYKYVVHGEKNLIYNACRNGTSLLGSTMYVYGLPVCPECAKAVIQVGVKKVIMMYDPKKSERWIEQGKLSEEMFSEVGIQTRTFFCE